MATIAENKNVIGIMCNRHCDRSGYNEVIKK